MKGWSMNFPDLQHEALPDLRPGLTRLLTVMLSLLASFGSGCSNTDCVGGYSLDIVDFPPGFSELDVLVEFEGRTIQFQCSEQFGVVYEDSLECSSQSGPWTVWFGLAFEGGAILTIRDAEAILAPRGTIRVELTSVKENFYIEHVTDPPERRLPSDSVCFAAGEIWEINS